jgi:hypothetical protein
MRELKVTSHEIKLIPVPKLTGGWKAASLAASWRAKGDPAGCVTCARAKRTTQQSGIPLFFLGKFPVVGRVGSPILRRVDAMQSAFVRLRIDPAPKVGKLEGQPKVRIGEDAADETRESDSRIRALTVGNEVARGPTRAKAAGAEQDFGGET